MEAHDRRLELVEHVGELRAERRARRRRRESRRRRCRARRSRARAPPARPPRASAIGRRRRVAEEVHVERLAWSARGSRPARSRMRLDGEQRARQRAEAAGVRHRDRERAALHAGHRRLDDRELDAQKFLERGITSQRIGANLKAAGGRSPRGGEIFPPWGHFDESHPTLLADPVEPPRPPARTGLGRGHPASSTATSRAPSAAPPMRT